MNKDISVITVPAAPPEKTSYGFLTLILLAYMLGNKFDANKYLYLNTMHSYKDKQGAAKQLSHDMESLNIKMDGVLYDSDFLGQFEKDLLLLKQKGYIKVKEVINDELVHFVFCKSHICELFFEEFFCITACNAESF